MEQLKPRRPRQNQIDQTRGWVAEALLLLMEERSYVTITLTDVAARSGIARQTLHRHFAQLDDVLLWVMDHTFEEFLAGLHGRSALDSPAAVEANLLSALEVCAHNRRFLRLLHRHGLSHLFLQKIEAFAAHLGGDWAANRDPNEHRYRLAWFAGGFHHLVMNWSSEEHPWPQERLVRLVRGLAAF